MEELLCQVCELNQDLDSGPHRTRTSGAHAGASPGYPRVTLNTGGHRGEFIFPKAKDEPTRKGLPTALPGLTAPASAHLERQYTRARGPSAFGLFYLLLPLALPSPETLLRPGGRVRPGQRSPTTAVPPGPGPAAGYKRRSLSTRPDAPHTTGGNRINKFLAAVSRPLDTRPPDGLACGCAESSRAGTVADRPRLFQAPYDLCSAALDRCPTRRGRCPIRREKCPTRRHSTFAARRSRWR